MAANAKPPAQKVIKPQRMLAENKKDIGYGIWYTLHCRAALADVDGSWQEYEKLFTMICNSMSGCDCDDHCKQMLREYPVKNYIKMRNKDGKLIGCLYHSSLCHNKVNARLGKVEFPFDQVEPLYLVKDEIKPCTAPANIDELADKFPGLIVKTEVPTNSQISQPRQGEQVQRGLVGRRFQFVKVT